MLALFAALRWWAAVSAFYSASSPPLFSQPGEEDSIEKLKQRIRLMRA